MEPGPGVGPESIRLGAGEAQGRAGLLDGEPGEDTELHELGRLRLRRRQPGQGLIDLQQIVVRRRAGEIDLEQVDPQAIAAVPAGRLRRARSMRMRRIASAAAAKKCRAFSQEEELDSPTRRR